jgi:prevent-host-death family protein
MAEIGIKELKNQTSKVIDEVEAGATYAVTKRGRLTAVIIPVDEAEDFVLAHASEFVNMRLEARRAHLAGRSSPLD